MGTPASRHRPEAFDSGVDGGGLQHQLVCLVRLQLRDQRLGRDVTVRFQQFHHCLPQGRPPEARIAAVVSLHGASELSGSLEPTRHYLVGRPG